MSKEIKGDHKHLTLSDRIYIEQALIRGDNFRTIAKFLGKDPSTISLEIRRFVEWDDGRISLKPGTDCIRFDSCDKTKMCSHAYGSKCGYCRLNHCEILCSRYEPFLCDDLNLPPYVCNSCKFQNTCRASKIYYRAEEAHKRYRTLLSESRAGINMTPEELKELDEFISPLIKQGQPLSHIFSVYSDTYDELGRLSMSGETEMFNDVFSIMAVQKQKEADAQIKESDNAFVRALRKLIRPDFSGEAWYVKGFEDYDTADYFVDITLTETSEGYLPQLPDKTWDIIVDCQTLLYQKDDEGRWRFLGADEIGGIDAKGHPLVGVSDTWVNINGHVVCYTAQPVIETDDGDVFTGTLDARLNGVKDITLQIEWDPVSDGKEAVTGRVTGYEYADNELYFMEKGSHQFKTGDSIEFIFDYYNEEGRKLGTEPYGGSILFTKDSNLKVEEKPLEEGDISFYEILTDAYQREIITEAVEAHIGG